MLEKIREIVCDYKSDDTLQVTETTTFEELGLDSLDMVELVMSLEDQLGLKIEMDNNVKDVAALLKLIENSPKA